VILLDTDHVNVLQSRGARGIALSARMEASTDQDFAITAITVEEQMRGWRALIHRTNDVHSQIPAYQRLIALFDFFARWHVVPFEDHAADEFKRHRKQGVRIATMDLKIAASALARDTLHLSANLRDFRQVPGVRAEDWLS
jgi:tRNA(fMet)-specific endonuclease VapC